MENTFETEYKRLNKAQKEAVDTIDGPVMVVAGPGTGKTQILALRVANILEKTDVGAESVLALTFTNAGVFSMRNRLLDIIGDIAYRVNIFTFHSFCENVIKEFPFYFTEFDGAHVIDDLEKVQIIEEIIKKNNFESLVSFHDEFSFLKDITSAIGKIKSEGVSPEMFVADIPVWRERLMASEDLYYKKAYGEYKKGDLKPSEKEKVDRKISKASELAIIFGEYQAELKSRGRYDFSDMILSVLAKLETNADLKSDLQEKYQYILVDEYQDTNDGQNRLIELLTDAPHLEGRANVFAVGDEKQSIYRFQGASRETFSHFDKIYRDVANITLSENYRSAQNILDGAHSLITHIPELETSTQLHSNIPENQKINVREFSNYKFELLHLAEDIKTKIAEGVEPREIAVIYRGHKYVADIKTVFDYNQIPYTIFSRNDILADISIRNLINILRVVENPNDDESIGKCLFISFLGFDAYDAVRIFDKFRSLRKAEKKHIFAIIDNTKNLKEIDVQNPEQFLAFAKMIKALKVDAENNDFPNFFKIFLEKTGYIKEMLEASDSRLRLLNIDKVFDAIKKQNLTKRGYQLSDFLYFVDTLSKYNISIDSSSPEIIEGVNLLTAHGAKGMEFKHVYIINTTRRGWEKSGSHASIALPINQYEGDIDDERRLFYVAMTRAKHGLSLSYSTSDNDGRENEKSEFIKEIKDESKFEETMKNFEEKNIDRLYEFITYQKSTQSLFDPAYLRELFFKRGLNVSALNNYFDCPKKYFYRNLIQIPSSYKSALVFGNLMHKSLELFFTSSSVAEKILPKKDLLKIFEVELGKTILSDKDVAKFETRGNKVLGEYYDEYSKNWTHRIKNEFHIKRQFELDTRELLTLSGVLDKIEFNDDLFEGQINIVDYKTGRSYSEKNRDEKKKYERQIIFYHLLLEDYNHGELSINKSTLDFVEKNKKGKFEQYSFDVTRDHLDGLRAEINQFADEVLSMEFLQKGCGKRDCEWCELGK